MDPVRIYHCIASISNTAITDTIANQVQDAPRILQDVFKKALKLEAGLELAEDIHTVRPDQAMQVSKEVQVQSNHKGLDRCVHHIHIKNN